MNSVNNNSGHVAGWAIGGLALGATAGGATGWFTAKHIKDGKLTDKFVNYAGNFAEKQVDTFFSQYKKALNSAVTKANAEEASNVLKEFCKNGKSNILRSWFGAEILTEKLATFTNPSNWKKEIEDAIKNFTNNRQLIKDLGIKETITDAFKTFRVKGKNVEVPNKSMQEFCTDALVHFKGRNALIFGGIGAGILGLAGLIVGLNKKDS